MTINSVKKNINIVALVLTAAVSTGHSGIAYAQGTGSSPKGKPFVEIAGQIVEVQSDISSLQAQHDEISDRVDALEENFQAQIDLLNAEILRLDGENDLRILEIQDLIAITTQNGFDVAFALSEILTT